MRLRRGERGRRYRNNASAMPPRLAREPALLHPGCPGDCAVSCQRLPARLSTIHDDLVERSRVATRAWGYLEEPCRETLSRISIATGRFIRSSSTNRGLSEDREVFRQLEMILPALCTRVEHARCLARLRISRRGPGPFSEGARNAGQGEVLLGRGPAIPPRLHVIDVKRRFLSGLGDAAVLAVIARPQADTALKR